MNPFFDFTTEYDSAAGFGMFSGAHFAWLAVSALICAALCLVYRRSGKRARLRRLVAASALLIELVRAGLLLVAGQYGLYRLPLHLCGMAVYFCFFHSLRGNRLIGQFLYALCAPGALFALVFPDWGYYPALHFMSVSAFVLHSLIVAYALMQVLGGDIVPDIRQGPKILGLMLLLAVPVFVFDKLTGTNYMFLNWPSPGSPLEWFTFLGNPGYVAGYVPIIAAVWALIFYPFRKKSAD